MITPILVLIGLAVYTVAKHYYKQHGLRNCYIESYSNKYLISEAIDTYYYINIVQCYGMSDFRYLRACEAEIQKRGIQDEYEATISDRIANRGLSEEQLDSAP